MKKEHNENSLLKDLIINRKLNKRELVKIRKKYRKNKKAYVILFFSIPLWIFFKTVVFFNFNQTEESFVTPTPPTRNQLFVLGLGDENLAYRIMTQRLQNMGDFFYLTTPLKNYNYKLIYTWLKTLSEANPTSHYAPTLASDYFANSQDDTQISDIALYLKEIATKNPETHYAYFAKSMLLYKEKYNDIFRIKKIATEIISLAKTTKIPLWVQTFGIFMLEENGQKCDAYQLIKQINQDEIKNITDLDVTIFEGSEIDLNKTKKILQNKIYSMKQKYKNRC